MFDLPLQNDGKEYAHVQLLLGNKSVMFSTFSRFICANQNIVSLFACTTVRHRKWHWFASSCLLGDRFESHFIWSVFLFLVLGSFCHRWKFWGRMGDISPYFLEILPLTYTFSNSNFCLKGPLSPLPLHTFSHKSPVLSFAAHELFWREGIRVLPVVVKLAFLLDGSHFVICAKSLSYFYCSTTVLANLQGTRRVPNDKFNDMM